MTTCTHRQFHNDNSHTRPLNEAFVKKAGESKLTTFLWPLDTSSHFIHVPVSTVKQEQAWCNITIIYTETVYGLCVQYSQLKTQVFLLSLPGAGWVRSYAQYQMYTRKYTGQHGVSMFLLWQDITVLKHHYSLSSEDYFRKVKLLSCWNVISLAFIGLGPFQTSLLYIIEGSMIWQRSLDQGISPLTEIWTQLCTRTWLRSLKSINLTKN